jgi:polyisoprenoid-binding protein YceI
MRTIFLFSVAVSLIATFTTCASGAEGTPVGISEGVATLSPENTRIQFVGTHVGPKPDPRTGVFTKFSGKVQIDPQSKVIKSITLDIQTNSLETPIAKLTNHLRSADFFDTREYPTARFQSTGIDVAGGDDGAQAIITGNLTLLKATKELKVPAKLQLSDQGVVLNAEFKIDRTQFGMSGFQENVNKEVAITVTIGQPTTPK